MESLTSLWLSFLEEINSAHASSSLVSSLFSSPNHFQFFLLCWLIIFFAFYLHSWLYLFADWGYFGQWVEKYAIRSPGKHRYASMKLQTQAIHEATLDTFLIKPVLFYFGFSYLQSSLSFESTLPSPLKCLYDWILLNFLFSTSLYFIHRSLHLSPFLYKNFHKKHHLFTATIGFTSLFAHPIESLASAFHFLFPIFFLKPHFLTFLLFHLSVTLEFVDSHCGYDVPWGWIYPWAEIYPWGSGVRIHDFHHSHNIGGFGGGLFGIWDRIFQTDQDYRSFEQKRRRLRLLEQQQQQKQQ
jgi:sterol desaturase/sphingolipid hydroxylase (fatty acid hydroxylase superfamily)